MIPVRALLEVPALIAGPLVCRLRRRHRWHVWMHHAAPTWRICVRCGHTQR